MSTVPTHVVSVNNTQIVLFLMHAIRPQAVFYELPAFFLFDFDVWEPNRCEDGGWDNPCHEDRHSTFTKYQQYNEIFHRRDFHVPTLIN